MARTSGVHPTKRRERADFRGLLSTARVSWSLLTNREKLFFAIRVLVRLALNLLDVVAVALMGLLGAITASGLSGQTLEIFGYDTPAPTATNVISIVATVAALFVVKGALAILFARWTSIFLANVTIKNSAKVVRYLFGGSLNRLRMYSRPEITYLAQSSVNSTFAGVLGSMTTLFVEITLFVSIFGLFMLVDWVSGLGILGYFVVLVAILQATTAKRFLASGRNLRKSSTRTGGSILELVDGFREIAVLSKQDFFITRFIEARKLSARTGLELQILKSLPRYIAESGLIIAAFVFTGWQLSQGSLAEGLMALGIFLAGSFRMMGAILPLQAVWNELRVIQESVEMAQNILILLRDTPELLDTNVFAKTTHVERFPDLDVSKRATPLSVRIERLSFTHLKSSSPAIKSISLDIPAGAYVAIVGPSGAGKSTLVDLLLGLYDPDKGSVRVGGEDPRVLREHSPGLLSYVPQRPGLVSGSLANNVALGVPDDEIEEDAVRESLRRARLLDFVDTLPKGIHSSLGPHADSLSGGQIQRLGFARALYTKPQLIILDEATSALDAATEASVASSIKNVGGETTVIVIAHRLSTIQDADQIHVMDAGKIIASGTFSEIRKAVPMVEEYVQLMSFRDE
jgi:ABC-type multidrug transport system fused ATPase/permease subunit